MNAALRKQLQQRPLIITTVLVKIYCVGIKTFLTMMEYIPFKSCEFHEFIYAFPYLQSPPYVMEDLSEVELDEKANEPSDHQKKVCRFELISKLII